MTAPAPTIRTMTRGDLDLVLRWADAEGWNPGLDDAAAFLAADPRGFLVADVGGASAAGLSIVRFGDATAFLGLYLCRADLRGRGIGRALWREGMARLAPRRTGLDGVPVQQENYTRSGFEISHRNIRFTGRVPRPAADGTEPLTPALVDAALDLDAGIAGFDRADFLRTWLTGDARREARAVLRGGDLAALGVIRRCVSGRKIGPLYAADRDSVETLFDGLALRAGDGPVSLDVPEPNTAALSLCEERGLSADFETARMWRGPVPRQDLGRTFGVTTLELG